MPAVESLTLLNVAAFAGTKKVLGPIAAKLVSFSVDPDRHASQGKIIEVSTSNQGLFSDWNKLKTLNLTRVQIKVMDKVQNKCALNALAINQCLVNGSLRWFLQSSKKSLTKLAINGATGLHLDDILGLIEETAPKLTDLCIRSTRYISDRTDRSFDKALSLCINLERLNLDLNVMPISAPASLLSACGKLVDLELKRADWIEWQDWLEILGATSLKLRTITIHNAQYWSAADRGKLQETWRWKGIRTVNFPQANSRNAWSGEWDRLV